MGQFIGGIGVGFFILMMLLKVFPNSVYNRYYEAKNTCEAKLPRDQECIVIGVPKESK